MGFSTPKSFHIANNTVQTVLGGGCVLHGYYLDNTANTATTYFQFFNAAAGNVTLGTTVPQFVIPVPANTAANLSIEGGAEFSALSFAATTTYNGSTAPTSAVDCTLFIE